MITSKPHVIPSLLAVAVAVALTAIHVQPAAAQAATDVVCDGCVQSRDIKDRTIRTEDLADSVLFGRTVFVPYAGNAAANCDALRDALAQIDDASAKNPVLVKLDRGNYQCGSTPIAMRPFVTIEGAGRSFSRIIGDTAGPDQGVIDGANESALRHLTVEHAADGIDTAIAIHTLGRRMSLTDVAIKVDSATSNDIFGVYAPGGMLDLTDVSVSTNNSAGGGRGIGADSGARLNMMNVWLRNHSVAGNPAAMQLIDSSVTGFGILFSSNIFSVVAVGDSTFDLVDGTMIGGRGVAGGFTGSFSCVGIAKEDFTARAADCT